MNVLCIVQARMASSRLPGKIAMPIDDDPMLAKVLKRLQRAQTVDAVVVATTDSVEDDATARIAADVAVPVVRGPVLDVLARFVQVLDLWPQADVIVRVTADCPFVDPGIVDEAVDLFRSRLVDYVTNQPATQDARTYPLGLAVEVFSAGELRRICNDKPSASEREHVTPRFYTDPQYRVGYVVTSSRASDLRWTVDTADDLRVVRCLQELVGPEPFGWLDVLQVARAHPEIAQINSDVEQKSAAELDARWGSSQ